MSDALPCPFCGGKPAIYDDLKNWYVVCEACSTFAPGSHVERSEAIAAWNRRAAPTAVDAPLFSYRHFKAKAEAAEAALAERDVRIAAAPRFDPANDGTMLPVADSYGTGEWVRFSDVS